MLLDLADGRSRKFFAKLDEGGNLEGRQSRSAPFENVGLAEGATPLSNDQRLYDLVEHRVGNSDDRGIHHIRMLANDCFHLARRDILASAFYEVFSAIDEEKVPILIHANVVPAV